MSKVRGQVPSSSQNDSSPSFVLETQFTVSVSFICAFNNCTLNLKPLIEAIYNTVQVSWLVKRVILFLIAKWASFDIHNHNCFFFQKNNEFPNDVYAMGTMIVGATMEVKMKLSLT